MEFNMPKDLSSIIKVIGVGGGGGNAVNHMYREGINGVDFIVCNTDQQALDNSPIPVKVQLGVSLTEGRGAGSVSDVGENAAIENLDEVHDILNNNTKMVFITAGMGGGTGTGAAPVIAQCAREMDILTVGIVTLPFSWEGRKRMDQAKVGIENIRKAVDTLLVINNDKLREMCGNLAMSEAFAKADDVLSIAARGIADIITRHGYINVDFEDVRTVMTNSGVAIMGSAMAEGEDRAERAAMEALASPLLDDSQINGARYVLLNITFGKKEVLMDEITDITDYIQEQAGASADVIWGYGLDDALDQEIGVTIIATGFDAQQSEGFSGGQKSERKIVDLDSDRPTMLTTSVEEKEEHETKEEHTPDEPYLIDKSDDGEQDDHVKVVSSSLNEEEPKPGKVVYELGDPDLELGTDTEAGKEEAGTAPVNKIHSDREEEPQAGHETDMETASEEDSSQFIFDFTGGKNAVPTGVPEEADPKAEEEPLANVTEGDFHADGNDPDAGREDSQTVEKEGKVSERISKLRELSMRLRTKQGISDLESEPAYVRKQIELEDTPHSSESHLSHLSVNEEETEDGERKSGLSDNNTFLHDRVD